MARFYLPPKAWTETPTLTGDEARHLSQVLRAKPGEAITVFDGAGRRASAIIQQVSRDRISLEIGEHSFSKKISPEITLAQAIPKGKNMELIVQKAVELGVSCIQPIVTANTVVQPGEGKPDKWRRTALEACKQCGQDYLPHIAEPMGYEQWMNRSEPKESLKIIASLTPEAALLKNIFRINHTSNMIDFLVGPEGDFTLEETQAAIHQGYTPVSLGNIILRVETATLFGLSAIRYEYA